jgi:hypothetical protein
MQSRLRCPLITVGQSRAGRPGFRILGPRSELDFPGPGAAVLAVQLQIALGDRGGIEHPVRAALVGARVAGAADAAIDDDMPT